MKRESRRARTRFAVVGSVFALLLGLGVGLGACGDEEDVQAKKPATEKDFDRDNFSDPTTIDNKWYPLAAGTQFIYEGRSNRGHGRLPHRVIFTVTDLTKVVNGVRNVVMWDRDINAGKLLEGELTFHAQDDDGNVWNFGEYPEEYDDNGKFEGAPDSWLAGVGATAGILMRGDPRVDTPPYLQGVAPKIGFGDEAFVYKEGQRTCVPLDCYDDVLVTDETNPLEPADGHQLKYYAQGVGNIRAAPRGGKEKEVLVLVDVVHLSPQARAQARKEALKLEQRAYVAQKKLFSHTRPAEYSPGLDKPE